MSPNGMLVAVRVPGGIQRYRRDPEGLTPLPLVFAHDGGAQQVWVADDGNVAYRDGSTGDLYAVDAQLATRAVKAFPLMGPVHLATKAIAGEAGGPVRCSRRFPPWTRRCSCRRAPSWRVTATAAP